MAAQTPKGNMPVVVLKDDASQVKGREAQKNNIDFYVKIKHCLVWQIGQIF